MKVLVLNTGSSSVKYKLFSMPVEIVLFSGIVESIGEEGNNIHNHTEAIQQAVKMLLTSNSINDLHDIQLVGHRVVHGGTFFNTSVVIDENVIESIESLVPLAPIHNRANLDGIYAIQSYLPDIRQVAVFDTAFHQTLSKAAFSYALPLELCEEYHIRRFGFHGTSHHYVAQQCAKLLNKELLDLNLITLHLGNGASVCAIASGKSMDTSMGFTPLEGLMMGTRCGDIDPSIVLYLIQNFDKTPEEVEKLLNYESGLRGVCGSNDMRNVEKMVMKGDINAQLAIDMFVRGIKKYIGAYIALLGSVDAIIFTGGIGEHSAIVRAKTMDNMLHLGFSLDREKNLHHDICISNENESLPIFVIATDEELEISKQSYSLVNSVDT